MNSEGTVFGARLGFFCNPVYHNGSQVLKKYSMKLTRDEAELLQRQHEGFIANLRSMGINVPETQSFIVEDHGKYSFEIVQDRFESYELAGEVIKNSNSDSVVLASRRIVEDAVKFLNSGLCGKMGFHPTVRNYAFREGQPYHIDTFPPFADEYSTRKWMKTAAPNLRSKVAMQVLSPALGFYTSEYYQPAPMIAGVVRTVSRLRPDAADETRTEITDLVRGVKAPWSEEVVGELNKDRPISRAFWKFTHLFY